MDITQMLTAAASGSGSQPGLTWTNNTTTGLAASTFDSASSGSVAVMTSGNRIYRSTDGLNWTLYNPFPSLAVSLYGVNYVNSEFVVWTPTFLAVSSDGITWTTKTAPGGDLRYVYGNGTSLVALSSNAGSYYTFTSADNGTTWVLGSTVFTYTSGSGSSANTQQMVWDGTKYVFAIRKFIYTSTDGLAWTLRTTFGTSSAASPKISIGYSGSVYFSICYPADSNSYWEGQTSTDGITWTVLWSTYVYSPGDAWLIYWDASTSQFLVKGFFGAMYSSTGTNSTLTSLFSGPSDSNGDKYYVPLSNAYGYKTTKIGSYYTYPGQYTLGVTYTTPLRYAYFPVVSNGLSAYTSGVLTTGFPFGVYRGFSSLTFNNKYIVSGGPTNPGTASIYYSTDGSSWTGAAAFTNASSATITYTSMCASSTKALALARMEHYYSSVPTTAIELLVTSDGVTWTPSVTPLSATASAPTICWTGSEFVFVASAYNVYSSSDGSTWTNTSVSFSGATYFSALAVDSTYAYAYGSSGNAMYRTLLGSWGGWVSFTPTNLFSTVTKVIYASGKFVAIGTNSVLSTYCVAYSTDGINFTQADAKISVGTDIYWNGFMFVAVSSTTGISTSPDGITWTLRTSATSAYSVTYKAAKYVAPGQFGQTITSS